MAEDGRPSKRGHCPRRLAIILAFFPIAVPYLVGRTIYLRKTGRIPQWTSK